MKTIAIAVLGCAMLAALPARAEVFSSQGFDGTTTTLDSLPGVNLDAVPGFATGSGNCTETDFPSFGTRGEFGSTRGTTCRVGNFSITTTGDGANRRLHDNTYGGNPPPWVPSWRP